MIGVGSKIEHKSSKYNYPSSQI